METLPTKFIYIKKSTGEKVAQGEWSWVAIQPRAQGVPLFLLLLRVSQEGIACVSLSWQLLPVPSISLRAYAVECSPMDTAPEQQVAGSPQQAVVEAVGRSALGRRRDPFSTWMKSFPDGEMTTRSFPCGKI